MKIEFSGAARNVTGSKHLLHVNGKKVLLDCGLFQGRRKKSEILNRNFPFNAADIDAVVLSHAHIDHTGALPLLVKQGYDKKIFCTPATRDLCNIMLPDSAYIQEKDAEWMAKKKKNPSAKPLYTMEDAMETLKLLHTYDYQETFSPVPGMKVRYIDAGHILGSALVEIEIEDFDSGDVIRIGFSGDIGRKDLPILNDPGYLEGLDVLITESTYGDRIHDDLIDIEDALAHRIKETYDRGGKIIIPAFAVGRTQEVLFVLRELQHDKKIPVMPIFIDSPLALKATKIFGEHPECFDSDLEVMLRRGQDPFCDCDGVQFVNSVDESKALNNFPGACIIISASGMCEAGRIRHHLANSIVDPKNLVLIVGFMAENTLGRKIAEKENPVKIFGEDHAFNSEVVSMRAFSAHADQNGLLDFAEHSGKVKDVFLVHGEIGPMETLKAKMEVLSNMGQAQVRIPKPGDIYTYDKHTKRFRKSPTVNAIAHVLCDVLEID